MYSDIGPIQGINIAKQKESIHSKPARRRYKSSPETPVYVASGQIDWDAIPDDIAEDMLAINDKILALQPGSGGFLIDQGAATAPH